MIVAGLAITALAGLAIAIIGALYLCIPRTIAASFGLTGIPNLANTSWLRVKGIRDATCGIVAAALLLTASADVTGWALLAFALIPLGDATTVLTTGGRASAAWGVHVPTALLMVAGAALLLLGSR